MSERNEVNTFKFKRANDKLAYLQPAYMQTWPNCLVELNCGTRGLGTGDWLIKLAHSSYETIPNS